MQLSYLHPPLVFVELNTSLGRLQDITATRYFSKFTETSLFRILSTDLPSKSTDTDLGAIPANMRRVSFLLGAKLTLIIFEGK